VSGVATTNATFSLREAVAMTGVRPWTIRQGWRNGTIGFVRVGDGTERIHRRMTAAQVETLSASRTVDPVVHLAPLDECAAAIAATRAALRRTAVTTSVRPR
jgi:hypothetical protein